MVDINTKTEDLRMNYRLVGIILLGINIYGMEKTLDKKRAEESEDAKRNQYALFRVVESGDLKNLIQMLEGMYHGYRDFNGLTILHEAAAKGNLEMVQWIAERYPDLAQIKGERNQTILHCAVYGSFAVLKWLAAKYPELIEIRQQVSGYSVVSDTTILQYAITSERPQVVEWLAQTYPFLIKLVNDDGDTAVDVAVKVGKPRMLKILIKYFSDFDKKATLFKAWDTQTIIFLLEEYPDLIDARDDNGFTVLHKAVQKEDRDLIKALVTKYPRLVTMVNKDGNTPLSLAVIIKKCRIVRLLGEMFPELLTARDSEGKTVIDKAKEIGYTHNQLEASGINRALKQQCTEFLLEAARSGNSETLQRLLSEGADHRAQEPSGATILHMAASGGHLEMVQWLAENYPEKIEMTLEDGKTILHLATIEGHFELVRWLVKKYPQLIEQADRLGFTILDAAVMRGHEKIFQWLAYEYPQLVVQSHERGMRLINLTSFTGAFNRETMFDASLIRMVDKNGCTLLHYAVEKGQLNVVQWLTNHYADLARIVDKDGNNVLFAAAKKGEVEIVKSLTKQLPDLVTVVKKNGTNVLHVAAFNGHLDLVKWLAHEYPDLVNAVTQRNVTVLHSAAASGHLEVLEWLADHDKHLVKVAQQKHPTLFYTAACNGHVNVMRWLAKQYPHLINIERANEDTVLHEALLLESVDLKAIQLLIKEYPALVAMIGKSGFGALHMAASKGHFDVVQWLAENYPDDMKQIYQGMTVLHAAVMSGHLELVRWLSQKDSALIDMVDLSGCTVLHLAAREGHLAIVKWLCQEHPKLCEVVDKESCTVLHRAVEHGHLKVIRWLCGHCPQLVTMVQQDGSTVLHIAAEGDNSQVVRWLAEAYPDLVIEGDLNAMIAADRAQQVGRADIVQWLDGQAFNVIELMSRTVTVRDIEQAKIVLKLLTRLSWTFDIRKQGTQLIHVGKWLIDSYNFLKEQSSSSGEMNKKSVKKKSNTEILNEIKEAAEKLIKEMSERLKR